MKAMNRFKQKFTELKKKNQKAFVPYIMSGDGGIDCLVERLLTLEKFGAAAVEVGIPFSDPVADGPTIQLAGIRSLKNGTTLTSVIKELEKARELVNIPIIIMTYLNPVYAYGIETFVHDIKKAGVDGCIIPDLPVEEEEIIEPMLKEAGIELIRLVTMTTPMERIETISKSGNGFLYTVTVKGITGVRQDYDQQLGDFLKAVKEISPIPVLAGFGVSTEEQVKKLSSYCDGVIVGSRIVELFAQGDLKSLEELMSVLLPEPKVL
jgi:tryptophan synthase alpha chain